MMYKIAFLLPHLESQGGVVVSVQTLAHYLSSLGHEVHLFPIGPTQIQESKFVHPINAKKKSAQLALTQKAYTTLAEQKPFDLTVSNHLVSNYILHHLNVGNRHLMILRQPSLLSKANPLSRLKKRILFPKIYNHKNIVMISQCLLNDFLEKYPYLNLRSSRVIYNSYDPEALTHKANEPITLPTKNPYIISVGRFTKTKNQVMLIKAFSQMKDQNIDLVLLGEGKKKQEFKTLVKQLGIAHRVHFVGWTSNPFPYIKQAKLLVHTSRSETFGRVVLEGLAVGTPVVSTDIKCGPNEILTGALKAFLVPLDHVSLLTQTMQKALTDYPPITSTYLDTFNVTTIARIYLDFIKDNFPST